MTNEERIERLEKLAASLFEAQNRAHENLRALSDSVSATTMRLAAAVNEDNQYLRQLADAVNRDSSYLRQLHEVMNHGRRATAAKGGATLNIHTFPTETVSEVECDERGDIKRVVKRARR